MCSATPPFGCPRSLCFWCVCSPPPHVHPPGLFSRQGQPLEHAVEEVDSHQALHGQEVKLLVGSGPDVDVVSSLVPQTPQGFSQTVWHLRRVLVEECWLVDWELHHHEARVHLPLSTTSLQSVPMTNFQTLSSPTRHLFAKSMFVQTHSMSRLTPWGLITWAGRLLWLWLYLHNLHVISTIRFWFRQRLSWHGFHRHLVRLGGRLGRLRWHSSTRHRSWMWHRSTKHHSTWNGSARPRRLHGGHGLTRHHRSWVTGIRWSGSHGHHRLGGRHGFSMHHWSWLHKPGRLSRHGLIRHRPHRWWLHGHGRLRWHGLVMHHRCWLHGHGRLRWHGTARHWLAEHGLPHQVCQVAEG